MAAHLPLFNLILMMKVESSLYICKSTGFYNFLQEQINCTPNVHANNQSAIQQNLPHC